jgi:hypothetical protein
MIFLFHCSLIFLLHGKIINCSIATHVPGGALSLSNFFEVSPEKASQKSLLNPPFVNGGEWIPNFVITAQF